MHARSLLALFSLCGLLSRTEGGFCDDVQERSFSRDITGHHCDGDLRSVYCHCGYETEYHSGRRQMDGAEQLDDDDDDDSLPDTWDSDEYDASLVSPAKQRVRQQKRSRRSSGRSRRSGYYEIEYECDKEFEEYCPMGCNQRTELCHSPETMCGNTWATSLNECPRNGLVLPVLYKTWMNVMESATTLNNREIEVRNDKLWFNQLFVSGVGLFEPGPNSSYVNLVNSGAGAVTATVDLPAELEAIRSQCVDQNAYAAYTCAYRLPECHDNQPTMSECVQKCEAISTDCIGGFYTACENLWDRLNQTGGDADFVCNTLYEMQGPDGCSSDSWWCDSIGGTGGVMGQGWRRKCEDMCGLYQQNIPKSDASAAFLSIGLLSLATAAATLI